MTGEIRGFCRNKDQEAEIVSYGLAAKSIFMDGRSAESFEYCFASFRGRPGTLILAQDLRAFGATKALVAQTMARLENSDVTVIDISNPGDITVSQMLHRAHALISGARFRHDKPRARRLGQKGGIQKGNAAAEKREQYVAKDVVDRIVDCPRLSWDDKERILAPHYTKATLRRHYGSHPTIYRN